MTNLRGLNHLLKAPSKAIVEKVFTIIFVGRNEIGTSCPEEVKLLLGLDTYAEAEEV